MRRPAQPYTRQELDPLRCQTPGCKCGGSLIMNPVCHDDGVDVRYAAGVLTVRCHVCEKEVAQVAVLDSRTSGDLTLPLSPGVQ